MDNGGPAEYGAASWGAFRPHQALLYPLCWETQAQADAVLNRSTPWDGVTCVGLKGPREHAARMNHSLISRGRYVRYLPVLVSNDPTMNSLLCMLNGGSCLVLRFWRRTDIGPAEYGAASWGAFRPRCCRS